MDLTKDINLKIIVPKQSDLFCLSNYDFFESKIPTMMSGIYCLYDAGKNLIYIGKSVNCMRQRLRTHLFTNPSKYLSDSNLEFLMEIRQKSMYFSFCHIEKKELIGTIEDLLILKFNPLLNREKKYYEK